jgi:hypothetical protein
VSMASLEERGSREVRVWPLQIIISLIMALAAIPAVVGSGIAAAISVICMGFLMISFQLEGIHASIIAGAWQAFAEQKAILAAQAEARKRAERSEAATIAEQRLREDEAAEADRQRRRENERLVEQLATPARKAATKKGDR